MYKCYPKEAFTLIVLVTAKNTSTASSLVQFIINKELHNIYLDEYITETTS